MKFLLFTIAVFLGILVVQGQLVLPSQREVTYGVCTLWGDVHIVTFDSATFDYQGICKYLVASYCGKDPNLKPFSIYAQNEYRNSITSVAWLQYIEIHYDNHIIILGPSPGLTASVDGTSIGLLVPYTTYSTFTIYISGGYVIFQPTVLNDGPIVEFDGNSRAYIFVPAVYSNYTCGICGNFDGDAPNDYQTKQGVNVLDRKDPGRWIGDSWVENVDCLFVNPTPTSLPACNNTKKPCWEEMCYELSNQIGVYGTSVQQLSNAVANAFFEDCILDACFTSGESIPSSILHFLHYVNALNPGCTSCQNTLNGFPTDYSLAHQNDTLCPCSPPYSNTMYVPQCGYWCDCIGRCDGYGTLYTCWELFVDDRCLWLSDPLSAPCTA